MFLSLLDSILLFSPKLCYLLCLLSSLFLFMQLPILEGNIEAWHIKFFGNLPSTRTRVCILCSVFLEWWCFQQTAHSFTMQRFTCFVALHLNQMHSFSFLFCCWVYQDFGCNGNTQTINIVKFALVVLWTVSPHCTCRELNERTLTIQASLCSASSTSSPALPFFTTFCSLCEQRTLTEIRKTSLKHSEHILGFRV